MSILQPLEDASASGIRWLILLVQLAYPTADLGAGHALRLNLMWTEEAQAFIIGEGFRTVGKVEEVLGW